MIYFMSTSRSNSTAYADADDLLVYHDARSVGQLLLDDGTMAAVGQIQASDTVTDHLKAASGLVEAAALRGERYTPTDLGTTLSGVSADLLKKMVCELAFWSLYARRNPTAEMSPSALWAFNMLDQLEKGERIFGFDEHAEAGNPDNGFMTQSEWDTLGLASDQADRFFGQRAKIRRLGTN